METSTVSGAFRPCSSHTARVTAQKENTDIIITVPLFEGYIHAYAFNVHAHVHKNHYIVGGISVFIPESDLFFF